MIFHSRQRFHNYLGIGQRHIVHKKCARRCLAEHTRLSNTRTKPPPLPHRGFLSTTFQMDGFIEPRFVAVHPDSQVPALHLPNLVRQGQL